MSAAKSVHTAVAPKATPSDTLDRPRPPLMAGHRKCTNGRARPSTAEILEGETYSYIGCRRASGGVSGAKRTRGALALAAEEGWDGGWAWAWAPAWLALAAELMRDVGSLPPCTLVPSAGPAAPLAAIRVLPARLALAVLGGPLAGKLPRPVRIPEEDESVVPCDEACGGGNAVVLASGLSLPTCGARLKTMLKDCSRWDTSISRRWLSLVSALPREWSSSNATNKECGYFI